MPLFKTMSLHLLEDRPELYEQLRTRRLLPTTLERMAGELKCSHESWKTLLSQERPGSAESQISSEALELALEELEGSLPPASPQDESEALSFLGAAMAFLRRHTPPA